MLTLLFLTAYALAGVRTAGWVYRELRDDLTPISSKRGDGVLSDGVLSGIAGAAWPVVQCARLSYYLGREALAPPLRGLFLSGYSRPGDKEKALLEAENAADAELARAQAEVDLETRLSDRSDPVTCQQCKWTVPEGGKCAMCGRTL